VETSPSSGSRKQQETEVKTDVRFLPDSLEQIGESMERLGPLRDKLYGAFHDAIARVNQNRQELNQPAIGTTKDDPKDDDLLR